MEMENQTTTIIVNSDKEVAVERLIAGTEGDNGFFLRFKLLGAAGRRQLRFQAQSRDHIQANQDKENQ